MIETYQRTIDDARAIAADPTERPEMRCVAEQVARTNEALLERERRLEALRGPLWPGR